MEFVWLLLTVGGLTVAGAHWFLGFRSEIRERAEVDDETRDTERLTLMLTLESLVGGSVRHFVSFSRLQRCLSWKTQQLSDVLAYCEQEGLLRVEGEPGPWSHEGTRAFLTARGGRFAAWVRAGCPDEEPRSTYTFNGPVTDSNFAESRGGDIWQATGSGRIDRRECHRLIQAVREEITPEILSAPDRTRFRSILDEIEDVLAEREPPNDRLRSLGSALRDVSLSAVGGGLWIAVSALVMYLTN